MAIQLIGAKWNYDISGSEKRYLVDSASEVGGLPEAPPDSRALVLDTGAAYIVNASGEWVETVIPAGGTGGGGGSDITVIPGTVSLDFSEGNMIVSPGTGKAYSSVLIPKPAALIPENIVDGVVIAGIEGTYEASGGGDAPSEPKETLLYENANASGFAVDPTFGVPVLQVYPAPFTMSYGKAYRVIWDGAEYLVATQPFAALGAIAVGDLTGFGGAGNGEPFVFGYVPAQNAVVFAGLDEKTSHSIAVYEIADNQCKCETPIFAVEHMDGFTQAEGVTPAVYQKLLSVGKVFSETEIPKFLTIQWDGVSYACPVYSYDGMIFAGNSRFLDSTSPDTGIPFGIVFVGQAEQMTVLATDPGTEHSIAIYHEIVECNGGGSGGGTVEGAATVTFMNGDAVYYTRPEIIGDDCPNPVTQGRVDAPKKESTAQYDYTYSGWSLTDGGAANTTNALKNITEDRTVYAAYTSAVRYYTITYYDSDGTTVLKTESLPYGAEITYSPIKDNKELDKWIPDVSPVVGDASYTATWKEEVTFAAGSWEDIIAIADAGQASERFAVGDEREETITYSDGTTETIVWQIADFGNRTVNVNGSERQANMVVISKHALQQTFEHSQSVNVFDGNFSAFLRDTLFPALPEALQAGIKQALISHSATGAKSYSNLWIPTNGMLNDTDGYVGTFTGYGYSASNENSPFALFSQGPTSLRVKTLGIDGAVTEYWLAGRLKSNFGGNCIYYIDTTGKTNYIISWSGRSYGLVPCFCI